MSSVSLSGESMYDSGSSISAITMLDLPNLPGIRSRIATKNPKIYKQYIDFKGPKPVEEENSLHSEDLSLLNQSLDNKSLSELTRSISMYPNQTNNYNDLTNRFSIKSKQASGHLLPFSDLSHVPSFVTNPTPNGRICRFVAYFNDASNKKDNSLTRTHVVIILYYLIDNTIEIVEPKVKNSGSIEGKILKRSKIKKNNKQIQLSPIKSYSRVSTDRSFSPLKDSPNKPLTSVSPIKPMTTYSTGYQSFPNTRLTSGSVDSLSSTSSVSSLTMVDSDYYTIYDFYAGAELNIYNTIYTIINCDQQTLNYFNDVISLPFGNPIDIPTIKDIDTCYVSSQHGLRGQLGGDTKNNKNTRRISKIAKNSSNYTILSKQFYEYDKLTLRFYGIWDNRDALYGDILHVLVHYRLADDTFEIVPDHHYTDEKNIYFDMKTILKRTKIYKNQSQNNIVNVPSTDLPTNLSINVLDHIPSRQSTAQSKQSTNSNKDERDYYHWSDLYIGYRLKIAAVDILLYDADKFTRTFYDSKELPLEDKLDYQKLINSKYEHKEEHVYATRRNSSMINLPTQSNSNDGYTIPTRISLIPEQAPKDGHKLKDFQGMSLRFQIRFNSCPPCDQSRTFILRYHLEDDTVDIKEVPSRNSGHIGGTYLYRSHVQNPLTNKYLQPKDLYISAIIYINSSEFIIFDADDSTLHYMEHNFNQFDYSNIDLIKSKLLDQSDVLKSLILSTKSLSTCIVTFDELEKLLKSINIFINTQEVVTLGRYMNGNNNNTVKLSKLLTLLLDYNNKSFDFNQ